MKIVEQNKTGPV